MSCDVTFTDIHTHIFLNLHLLSKDEVLLSNIHWHVHNNFRKDSNWIFWSSHYLSSKKSKDNDSILHIHVKNSKIKQNLLKRQVEDLKTLLNTTIKALDKNNSISSYEVLFFIAQYSNTCFNRIIKSYYYVESQSKIKTPFYNNYYLFELTHWRRNELYTPVYRSIQYKLSPYASRFILISSNSEDISIWFVNKSCENFEKKINNLNLYNIYNKTERLESLKILYEPEVL